MRQEIERVKTSLQIEEDISLHETGWIVQRVGWGFIFIFLVLASLGLFGNGVLSQTKVAREVEDIKYAILEKSGDITIVPFRSL